jgi:hypothetical protein
VHREEKNKKKIKQQFFFWKTFKHHKFCLSLIFNRLKIFLENFFKRTKLKKKIFGIYENDF